MYRPPPTVHRPSEAMTDTTTNPLRSGLRMQRTPEPCTMVIFGATGDLTHRKLVPGLYNLNRERLLPPGFSVIGFARRDWTDDYFRETLEEDVKQFSRSGIEDPLWKSFAEGISYNRASFDDPAGYTALADKLNALDEQRGTGGNRLFYLATGPESFATIIQQLGAAGLNKSPNGGWTRIIIEKPFGRDLESARALNSEVHKVFDEAQVYRIDHYLGKETVQNILALRFANQLYEPIWNANYVDHVQITMAEDIGVGGRAGYYDGIGAARDVIQNHLLQLLALTAMEEPVSFAAKDLRAEKEKVLSAVTLPKDLSHSTARGQYASGWQGGEEVVGFLEEDGMNPQSLTETFAAFRLDIGTRRWAGVPFYLRAGKRLGRRVTEIAVVFKRAPQSLFAESQTSALGQNALVIRVQPDEGVTIRFGSKVPGAGVQVRDVTMDFGYGHAFTEASPEAYERLILDVLLGDPPLFPRHQEVELSWEILDPIEEFWATQGQPEQYRPGSWGPKSADDLLARDGRVWRRP